MVVGIIQVELRIDECPSLKEKRRIVTSIKDRLHRQHQVSVAEVDALDEHGLAVLGITMASCNVPHCQSVIDRIMRQLNRERDCYVSDHNQQILTGQGPGDDADQA